MLSLPAGVRILLAREPADMRKSFDGLAALVQQALHADLFSGQWFVFRGKRGDRLKVLCWDGDGLVIYYKSQESDCPHSCPCTKFGERAHNLPVGPTLPDALD